MSMLRKEDVNGKEGRYQEKQILRKERKMCKGKK